jgi:hypothetical protein
MSQLAMLSNEKKTGAGKRAGGEHEINSRAETGLFPDHFAVVQQTLGNQAAMRLLRSGAVQAKLTVSRPDDVYEQEADRMADEVLRMPEPVLHARPGRPFVQGPSRGHEEGAQQKPAEITPLARRRAPVEEEELSRSGETGDETAEVSAGIENRIEALQGGGRPLPQRTRGFMEKRFGADFGGVRVHSDAGANELARSLNARAFTAGRDIVFGAGSFVPETESGKHLLAHELTHVVQKERTAATRLTVQRWEAGEHLEIGETTGVREVIVHPGDPVRSILPYKIPFAEMGAFGDYYATFDDMKKEAESDKGRKKLDFLRWKFRQEAGKPASQQPPISDDEKKEIDTLYRQLAASNIAHFASGNKARDEYRKYHEQSLLEAFIAGYSGKQDLLKEAMAKEAFGAHFYEDSFSSGHIRTPRGEIKSWYDTKFPRAFDDFIEHIGTHMATKMAEKYTTLTVVKAKREVMNVLRPMANPYRGAFSLGDIVSKAIHDAEGAGLSVVSAASPNGSKVPGGYKWTAVGDAQLKTSHDTKKILAAGLKVSTDEINNAFHAGEQQKNTKGGFQKIADNFIKTNCVPPYAPESFMPKPDPSVPDVSQTYPWEWGTFDAKMKQVLENSIKAGIVPELQGFSAQVKELITVDVRILGRYDLEPRKAFESFVTKFAADPIGILEKIVKQKCTP